jgi:hypothetical protein
MRGRTASHPTLEIHVPITPNRLMTNMVHCLVLTLRRFGGAYSDARFVLTIGDRDFDYAAYENGVPWLRRRGVEVRTVRDDLYETHSIGATAFQRFFYDYQSDVVLLLDADTLIARPFDAMVAEANTRRGVSGLIAYMCPFSSADRWQEIFADCDVPLPQLKFEHSAWGSYYDDPARRYCPAYFNFGVVCASRDAMTRLGADFLSVYQRVPRIDDTEFRAQVTLAVTIAKTNTPAAALPMRYNFSNHPDIEPAFPEELAHAAILHLLAENDGVYKNRLFDSEEAIEAFMARTDLIGTNELARERIAAIWDDFLLDQRDVDKSVYAPDGYR